MVLGFGWGNETHSDHGEGPLPSECYNARNFLIIILKIGKIVEFGRKNFIFQFWSESNHGGGSSGLKRLIYRSRNNRRNFHSICPKFGMLFGFKQLPSPPHNFIVSSNLLWRKLNSQFLHVLWLYGAPSFFSFLGSLLEIRESTLTPPLCRRDMVRKYVENNMKKYMGIHEKYEGICRNM